MRGAAAAGQAGGRCHRRCVIDGIEIEWILKMSATEAASHLSATRVW